jgi:FkbM family methyltransferase
MSGSNLERYLRRFGIVRGLRLYAAGKFGHDIVELSVPGLAHPVALRARHSDRDAFLQVFVDEEYDVPYPGRPRLIIDAGANVGCAAAYFANRFPGVSVVSIEPDATNAGLAERNASRYPNTRVVRGGVWPRDAELIIDNPTAKPWAFRVREARPDESGLRAYPIQRLLAESGHEVIDILKLDVEGTELELFSDPACDEWLSRTNMLFVETHDRTRPGCTAALDAAVSRHAFTRSRRGENIVLLRDRLL